MKPAVVDRVSIVVVVVESVGDDVGVRDGAGGKKLAVFGENSLVRPIFAFFFGFQASLGFVTW